MDMPPDLAATVAQQWGLVSARQLSGAGMSRGAIRWALRTHWRLVLPGVFLIDRRPVRDAHRVLAAVLYAGPEAYVVGACAARLHGVSAASEKHVVRVAVPRARHKADVGFVRLSRPAHPDLVRELQGILCASAPRAVVTAARAAHAGEARAIVIEAVQHNLVTVEQLTAENDLHSRAGSRLTRLAIDAAARGAWSVPEDDLGALVTSSPQLPTPLMNPLLTTLAGEPLLTPDVWLDDVGLALMVHSRRYHSGDRDFDATLYADGQLVAAGVTVLAFTPRQIRDEPKVVLATVERTYAMLRLRGLRASVHALPR